MRQPSFFSFLFFLEGGWGGGLELVIFLTKIFFWGVRGEGGWRGMELVNFFTMNPILR